MRSAADMLGNPSLPMDTAADSPRGQPNSRPLGGYTGAPPPTRFSNILVAPVGGSPTRIVEGTRENRFVTLIAPLVGFLIYIDGGSGVSLTQGIALPPGIPYEVSLSGTQELYAVTNAPIYMRVRVQIAPALVGDLERRI